ncbi:MAG: hypothetical protein HY893_10380 [Deltaproteobacteria bacterium]|nr:hypothetical protein [Deltaproteobacteria bacterium]
MAKSSQKGFSIAEILVVMGLAATIIAIGAPALIREMSHLRLKRSVMDVSTELNAARMKAIANNTKYRVEFTLNAAPTPDTFKLAYYDTGTSTWVPDPKHATKGVEPGIDITSPNADFQVEFYPTGTGTNKDICLQNTATDRMKVSVEFAVGKITVDTGC